MLQSCYVHATLCRRHLARSRARVLCFDLLMHALPLDDLPLLVGQNQGGHIVTPHTAETTVSSQLFTYGTPACLRKMMGSEEAFGGGGVGLVWFGLVGVRVVVTPFVCVCARGGWGWGWKGRKGAVILPPPVSKKGGDPRAFMMYAYSQYY